MTWTGAPFGGHRRAGWRAGSRRTPHPAPGRGSAATATPEAPQAAVIPRPSKRIALAASPRRPRSSRTQDLRVAGTVALVIMMRPGLRAWANCAAMANLRACPSAAGSDTAWGSSAATATGGATLGDVTIYGWAGASWACCSILQAYGALQLGFLRGSSWRYTVLKHDRPRPSILFSLLENWNLFSAHDSRSSGS